jgi:hypothetical protein
LRYLPTTGAAFGLHGLTPEAAAAPIAVTSGCKFPTSCCSPWLLQLKLLEILLLLLLTIPT